MKRLLLVSVYLLLSVFIAGAPSEAVNEQRPTRFVPLHIYLDCGEHELAAYQFELKVTCGDVKIVGVEGGEHPAFSNPPYYDPQALTEGRIIVAAFSTDTVLPSGRLRIATLHLQITGDVEPDYDLTLTISADAQGKSIPATITFQQGETQ